MDTFEDYLLKKKIDSEAFRQADTGIWEEWKGLFEQMHPDSFTAQKLFQINKIRRRFPIQEAALSATVREGEGLPPENKDVTKKG